MEKRGAQQSIDDINSTQAILRTPYFFDNARTELLNEGKIDELEDSSNTGFREFAHAVCLRMIRRNQHQNPGTNVPELDESQAERVDLLTRKMSIINQAEEALFALSQKPNISRREEYDIALLNTVLQKPLPCVIDNTSGKPLRYFIHGGISIAPTGFGKTGNMAHMADYLGVGRPLKYTPDHLSAPPRMCIIVPTLELGDQLADPNETFRRFGPQGISVSQFNGSIKDASANVVIIPIDSFVRHFENNRIAGQGEPFDILAIDEAHTLTAAGFIKTLIERQWEGITFGFTATPGYHIRKDVRSIFPYSVELYDLKESTTNGDLNAAELYVFSLDQIAVDRLVEEKKDILTEHNFKEILQKRIDEYVIDFVTPLVEEGRRGIIFCRQGQKGKHAKELANALSRISLSNGKRICAKSISTYDPTSADTLADFRKGKIDILTTRTKASMGFDPGEHSSIDFVVMHDVTSKLLLTQMLGRGTRPSKEFPTTIYAQFINPYRSDHSKRPVLLHEIFDLDHVEQGCYIGPDPKNRSSKESNLFYESLPPHLLDLARHIEGKKLGELAIGVEKGKRAVPEDYIPLDVIIEGRAVSEGQAKEWLYRADYAWAGEFVFTEDGERKLIHYYSTDAKEYIETNFARHDAIAARDIAARHNVSLATIHKIASRLGLTKKIKLNENNKNSVSYEKADAQIIEEEMGDYPAATPIHKDITSLARKLGVSKDLLNTYINELQIKTGVYTTKKGLATCIEKEDEKKIEDYNNSIPLALSTDMTERDIADALGVSVKILQHNLNDEEQASTHLKRVKIISNKGKDNEKERQVRMLVWENDKGRAVIERLQKLRPRPLPPYLIPTTLLKDFVSNFTAKYTMRDVQAIAERHGETIEELRLTNTRQATKFVSWRLVKILQTQAGAKESADLSLDFRKLPYNKFDTDREKIDYAQKIQKQLLPTVILENLESYVQQPIKAKEARPKQRKQRIDLGEFLTNTLPPMQKTLKDDKKALPEVDEFSTQEKNTVVISLQALSSTYHIDPTVLPTILQKLPYKEDVIRDSSNQITGLKGFAMPFFERACQKYQPAPKDHKNPYEIGKRYNINPKSIKEYVRSLSPPTESLVLYWTQTEQPYLTVHYLPWLSKRVEAWAEEIASRRLDSTK